MATFDSGNKFSPSNDELIPEKEPPPRFAKDYDPALAERSHPYSIEGEIQMLGDLAQGANLSNQENVERLPKMALKFIVLIPAAIFLLFFVVTNW